MEQIQIDIPLQDALDSSEGFVIRPFVDLKGQRKGYQFDAKIKGRWTLFMNAGIKNFNKEITGIYLYKVCTTSTLKIKDKYFYNRIKEINVLTKMLLQTHCLKVSAA